MLLARQNYSFKVKALTYCDNLDLLSVGLSNGMIVNYTFEIQSRDPNTETKNSFYKKEPSCKQTEKNVCCIHGFHIQDV